MNFQLVGTKRIASDLSEETFNQKQVKKYQSQHFMPKLWEIKLATSAGLNTLIDKVKVELHK